MPAARPASPGKLRNALQPKQPASVRGKCLGSAATRAAKRSGSQSPAIPNKAAPHEWCELARLRQSLCHQRPASRLPTRRASEGSRIPCSADCRYAAMLRSPAPNAAVQPLPTGTCLRVRCHLQPRQLLARQPSAAPTWQNTAAPSADPPPACARAAVHATAPRCATIPQPCTTSYATAAASPYLAAAVRCRSVMPRSPHLQRWLPRYSLRPG